MELVFTKGPHKHDQLLIRRPGQADERIECPKQRIIPHDMVHYAVESTLRRRGFLSRVRDGEQATFRMQPEAESDGVERLVEVIQGDAWSGAASAPLDLIDLYRVTCTARECPPLAVGEADIDAIRGRIGDLTVCWEQLAVGQSLTLEMADE
jgi:hypothetical protein